MAVFWAAGFGSAFYIKPVREVLEAVLGAVIKVDYVAGAIVLEGSVVAWPWAPGLSIGAGFAGAKMGSVPSVVGALCVPELAADVVTYVVAGISMEDVGLAWLVAGAGLA